MDFEIRQLELELQKQESIENGLKKLQGLYDKYEKQLEIETNPKKAEFLKGLLQGIDLTLAVTRHNNFEM